MSPMITTTDVAQLELTGASQAAASQLVRARFPGHWPKRVNEPEVHVDHRERSVGLDIT